MTSESGTSWQEDFARCADFHGHVCPGLAMGYRAAKAAMTWLGERRAPDEEVVVIAETDACGCDAIQVLTGCTFGKGNFIFRDYGKTAFSFFSRASGKGVRLAAKPGAIPLTPRHRVLFEKLGTGDATAAERQEFWDLHRQKCQEVLERPLDDLFFSREITVPLPPRAQVAKSRTCDSCGEPAMATKVVERNGVALCRACLEKEETREKKE